MKKKKRRKKNHLYPKKPLTPFFLYSQVHRARVTDEVTLETGKKDVAEVGRRLGKLWNKEPDHVKLEFKDQFEKNKIEYNKEVSDFKSKNPNISFYSASGESSPSEQSSSEDEDNLPLYQYSDDEPNYYSEDYASRYHQSSDEDYEDVFQPPQKRRKLVISTVKYANPNLVGIDVAEHNTPPGLQKPKSAFDLFRFTKKQRLMGLDKYHTVKGVVDHDRITIDLSRMWKVLDEDIKEDFMGDFQILVDDYEKRCKAYKRKLGKKKKKKKRKKRNKPKVKKGTPKKRKGTPQKIIPISPMLVNSPLKNISPLIKNILPGTSFGGKFGAIDFGTIPPVPKFPPPPPDD